MDFKIKLFLIFIFTIFNIVDGFSLIRNSVPENTTPNPDLQKVTPSILKKCDECPTGIKCVPQIQCPAHVRMLKHEKPQICDLPGEQFGFCCVTGQNHTAKSAKERFALSNPIHISIIEEARIKFSKLIDDSQFISVPRRNPEFLHHMVFHSSPQENLHNFQISNSAVEEVITSQVFKEKEQIPVEDFETNSIDVEFESSPLGHHCPSRPNCEKSANSKYRILDGSCNNPIPHRNIWGSAGQPMERILPPAYEDGIWLPRIHSAVDGSPLLSARETSRILFADNNRPHPKYNLLVMQFGQFIAHDVTQSSSITLGDGKGIECCSADGSSILPPEKSHYACMPIPIDPHDKFYRTFNQGCINFVRLSLSPNSECKMSYGKQRSKVTHYLDGSPIYGSSLSSSKELRSFQNGKLRMFNDFGRDLLPLSENKDTCANSDRGNICFKSGDGRTNQIISLVAVHIIFAREHNRICDILSQINPQWPDEVLYQEARRIVIGELQHIVYNEWLPIVIGRDQLFRFSLNVRQHGFADDYSPEINPAVTNEFTGAALRFGHSTVDGKFHVHRDNNIDEVIDIPDVMFNPTRMRKRNFLDDLMKTMLEQPMQKVDNSLTHGLTRFLFRGENPFGLDLAALNIQRGRDEALRSYNDYLELNGQRKITSFNQFSPEIARKLSEVYRHPDDIDLWVGGLIEPADADAVVGTTFSNIIADQFSRLRHGDRYFFENGPEINPGAFSNKQLSEIRKVTMSRLICDNLDHINSNTISPSAFVRADIRGNQPLDCASLQIPTINFHAWKDVRN